MKRKIRSELNRLLSFSLIAAAVIANVQCNSRKTPEISVFSSSQGGDRLAKKAGVSFTTKSEANLPVIEIDTATRFQKIDGFGATFNEAGMICLNALTPESRDSVLRNLFDPENGAGFNLMKSPIAACDFMSAGPWFTYNDTPGDTAMVHFSIERDLRPDGLVSFIKAASRFGKFEIESILLSTVTISASGCISGSI